MQKFKLRFKELLSNHFPDKEIGQFYKLILRDKFDFTNTELVLGERLLDTKEIRFLEYAAQELLQNKPIQQIIGFNYFHDLKFEVNEFTLIPRPETEELVEWILEDFDIGSGLDIGTGTGCIPISLANQGLAMIGLDVSKEALEMAERNAEINELNVEFLQKDILFENLIDLNQQFDFVVSNPPYVLESEKIEMTKSVLDFEPHLALFVADDDALLFYREIALKAKQVLKKRGKLYFEIHENKSQEVIKLLSEIGYSEIEMKLDLQGKPRMIKAIYNSCQ